MGERERIARYFAPLSAADVGSFALTDDAALLTPPAGESLIVTTDSVIEGVHVLMGAAPQQFAQKLVRRNLSDLAAMGATPWRYTLNLHAPHGLNDAWFAAFAYTLAAEQAMFGMVLIGGDSTTAPAAAIHATMTCFGLTPAAPLRRNGAKIGDDLYVSGTIGDAALGLKMLQRHLPETAACIGRYHCPQPRLALGVALRGVATAAMDISDGLLQDIHTLCAASSVGVTVMCGQIPLSQAAQHLLQQNDALWDSILNGGDDYELLFTAPPNRRTELDGYATRIGEITAAKDVVVLDERGICIQMPAAGYSHD